MASDASKFATTHWSVVLRAGKNTDAESASALEELCRNYWRPIYHHVRQRGYGPEEAKDLTQEFFARLLAKNSIGVADAQRGRFRSFLLGTLKHFLSDQWDRAHCAKRGGGHPHLSFDFNSAEETFLLEPPSSTPEAAFDRSWALRLLEQAQLRLQQEYASDGAPVTYEVLEQFLPGEASQVTYAQAAASLHLPEGTLKADVHRFKRRFGELLREAVAQSVAGPDEVDDELQYLIEVLARS